MYVLLYVLTVLRLLEARLVNVVVLLHDVVRLQSQVLLLAIATEGR